MFWGRKYKKFFKITVVIILNILEENAKSTSQKYSRLFHSSVEFSNFLCGGTAPALLWQLLPSYNKEMKGFSYGICRPKQLYITAIQQLYIPLRPLSTALLSHADLCCTCTWTDITVHICLHTNPKASFEDFIFIVAVKATDRI